MERLKNRRVFRINSRHNLTIHRAMRLCNRNEASSPKSRAHFMFQEADEESRRDTMRVPV
jgi:hypothetical protein